MIILLSAICFLLCAVVILGFQVRALRWRVDELEEWQRKQETFTSARLDLKRRMLRELE